MATTPAAAAFEQVVSQPALAVPSSVGFGNVLAGVNYSQTIVLSNTGSGNLTVTQIAASGNGFGVSGLSLPITLLAGQSASLAVGFDSSTSGNASGVVTIASNAGASPTTIGLTAMVAASVVQISANTSSINFGNTALSTTTTQNVTLTNTGNSAVSISSVSAGGSGFTVIGASSVTLAPGQATNATVGFDPAGAGTATGTLTVMSNAPEVQIGLSGTGAAPGQHSVTLNWTASISSVIGYYVYRAIGSGTQLSKLFTAIDPSTTYTDSAVASGTTYTYAVTSVDSNYVESALSTPVTVTIPSP